MAPAVVALFVAINLYVYFVSHMVRMMRDRHGERHGFILSNIIIVAAITFAVLMGVL